MAAAFVITDNGDGTGATATVTGSGVGVSNVVTVFRATGQTGEMTGTPHSRTGDGTISLPVELGQWFAYATSGGAAAGVFYFAASDVTLAVATRVRRAIKNTLELLSLPPAQRVYEQMYPDERNIAFPCALVTVEGLSETVAQSFSQRDDIEHPVKVEIADRHGKNDHKMLPTYERWREAFARCFVAQQLAGVPESVTCRVDFNIIIDPNLPNYDHVVSGFIVRAVCREPRGVGA